MIAVINLKDLDLPFSQLQLEFLGTGGQELPVQALIKHAFTSRNINCNKKHIAL